MVKAGDSIPDVQVHARQQCPTTEAGRGLARGAVARGLRHEPTATVTQRRAEDRETVVSTRPAETRHYVRERQQAHNNHAQDGLEFNPPVFLDVRKACAGKKVLIMGLPGAFTPC